jgi:hypothetical protein
LPIERALERECAARIRSFGTEFRDRRLTAVSLKVELPGDRAVALAAAKRALEAVGAEGATIT